MKKIVSKDLDFDSQLEDILSLDRGIPSDIGETIKNLSLIHISEPTRR